MSAARWCRIAALCVPCPDCEAEAGRECRRDAHGPWPDDCPPRVSMRRRADAERLGYRTIFNDVGLPAGAEWRGAA